MCLRCLFLFIAYFQPLLPLALSPEIAHEIGERIWKNECAGTLEGLTTWNQGEGFPSFGIGHFIWYPVGKQERFQETFPALLEFLLKEGAVLPNWLTTTSGCPWNCREDFYKEIHSQKMESLRKLLFNTRDLQAIFIANRLESAFPEIIKSCPPLESDKIKDLLGRLMKDKDGLFALIDYLNFKGSGTSAQETYKGQGWGLLQVLQHMPSSSKEPLIDFVQSAKDVLRQRVQNSPPQRSEEQWLKGWFNRLDTYVQAQQRIKN